MCGRFTQAYSWSELVALYRLTVPPLNLDPHYNIAPTSTIDVIVPSESGLDLARMRWGLIPWWWKKPVREPASTFNALVEKVAAKPMFRDAFTHNRCVIPASGYYEWRPTARGKQPYYITSTEAPLLSMAGVWDRWKKIETGEPVVSCTVIVTVANAVTRPVHDRMPVLLGPRDISAWLHGEAGTELLKPAPDESLCMWRVSRRVNRTGGSDDPGLIEPLAGSDAMIKGK